MGKKQNIIHINGKRYDAHSGAPLDHVQETSSSAVVKPIAVKHEPSKPHKVHHSEHATRRAGKSVTHHKQQRSSTLMRQAVHKPGTSLKRHTKAQSDLASTIEQPSVKVAPKLSFSVTSPKRLELAKRVKRSDLIMHFNPNQPDYSTQRITVTVSQPAKQASAGQAKPKPVPRQEAPDIDDIFERAIQNATSHLEPAPKKTRKHRIHIGRKHVRA